MPSNYAEREFYEQSLYIFWKLLLYNYFNLTYLFLFSEFCFHLFVPRLILSNAMSSYKIAADVSQLWILFASFLYQSKKIIYIWKLSIAEWKKFTLLFVRSPWKWKYTYVLPIYLTKWSWCFFSTGLNRNHCHSSPCRSVDQTLYNTRYKADLYWRTKWSWYFKLSNLAVMIY